MIFVRTVMKQTKRIISVTAVLMGFSLFTFQACSGKPADSQAIRPADRTEEGRVALTPDAARTAGIKTEAVQVRSFHPSIKASGTVALNQKRYVKLTPRTSGRVEKVFAFEGDHVRAGQELYWLWSPDIMAAQAEYLQIQARVPSAGLSASSDEEKLRASLLASAQTRLRLMGFEEADLAALRRNGQALPVLVVRAPISGTVVEADAVVGAAAEMGTCLCAIADLTTLWVDVHLFETDLSSVAAGRKAELTVAAYSGEIFRGRLTQVGSLMDEATRTVKGRVEVANPDGRLKPGMFAEVRIIAENPLMMLAIPERAVRTIAGRTVVFVAQPGGVFVRRDIKKGREIEGYVEVLEGLKEGENVVTDGSFDIKAEMLKSTLEGEK
jgi:cobalt-zinc-cadmium efflux system membrane fusion protein